MADREAGLPQLAAGSLVAGRFRLVRLLGTGASGSVWMAGDEAGRRVALKFAGPAPHAEALLRAGFAQAHRLVHPGILRPLEFVEGPPACSVMPCVEGGDLGALRGAGWRPVLAALSDIAEALDHAHRQGIVHRDLKPANVLRAADGHWLLTDFGSGAWAQGGSLPAMSPQQLAGLPPAAADDIYGLGALAYELLAGQPLFHPEVSAARIGGESPVVPGTDLGGAPLPPTLRALLAAMLEKDAARRPVSAAAVRAAIAGMQAAAADDAAGILPLAPRAALPPRPAARHAGLPAAAVYGGLAALLVVAVLVIGFLPGWMRARAPVVPAPISAPAPIPTRPTAATPAAGAPAADPGAAQVATAGQVPQAELDAALSEFLRLDDELKKAGADRWAGADWQALRRQAVLADDAYRQRDMAAALAGYRSATGLGRAMLARAPAVLAEALAAGEAALQAGRQAEAAAAFTRALAVAPADSRARRGLDRAGKLEQVQALVAQGQAAESAGQRTTALGLYRQAAVLDPDWTAAGAGVARLSQAAAREAYETQMARGLAGQAAGQLPAARAAFTAALQARPGDAAAQAALAQLDAEQKAAQLGALEAEARAFAQAERWADALQRYEQLLAADPQLVAAREGSEQARARLGLDTRLRREIASADQFNDDAVLARAQAGLEAARALLPAGPVLTGQVAELGRLLAIAATPVPVVLESDNLTEVTLFKVGRLGAFSSRTLELRPGLYTVVGARPGYRDVRRSFRVVADGGRVPVVVRCEDAI